jgi:type IV pilus assembly protein PilO
MFKPNGEVPKGFYAELPIQLRLSGTYHDIALFFDKIGKLERIVNVSDIELGAPKKENGQIVLDVTCNATTFQFTGGAGLPAPSQNRG